MSVTLVSFINRYPVIHKVKAIPRAPDSQRVEWLFAPVDFKLGLGPCGKVVTRLEVEFRDTLMGITQTHEDGSTKEFIYQVGDIAGRIVIEDTGE